MANNFKYDVFFSYSSQDKAVVLTLTERLRADGLRVWFDNWEIRAGDSIPAKIEAGLEQSRVLVLCMSANAFGSEWAQLESYTFRYRDPLNTERRFIPLRLDAAPIKGSLAQFQYITGNRSRASRSMRNCSKPAARPRRSLQKNRRPLASDSRRKSARSAISIGFAPLPSARVAHMRCRGQMTIRCECGK